MMLRIDSNFDPLKICMVGDIYDPSVFADVKDIGIRKKLERLVAETAEDLAAIQKFLVGKGIQVLRPDPTDLMVAGKFLPSMLTPRDHVAMIQEKFFMPGPTLDNKWNVFRGVDWPIQVPDDLSVLQDQIKAELRDYGVNQLSDLYDYDFRSFVSLERFIKDNGNTIVYDNQIDSAMYRIYGDKIYVGSNEGDDAACLADKVRLLFPDLESIIVPSQGHLDGVMFIACEGLLFSNRDLPLEFYKTHFDGWEIVYNEVTYKDDLSIADHRIKNRGKWVLDDFDKDTDLHEYVDTYLSSWVGDITESVFDVNLLTLDDKNICCVRENKNNFKILEKYGITAHVLPFRHHRFWDAGIHCLTADIHRSPKIK